MPNVDVKIYRFDRIHTKSGFCVCCIRNRNGALLGYYWAVRTTRPPICDIVWQIKFTDRKVYGHATKHSINNDRASMPSCLPLTTARRYHRRRRRRHRRRRCIRMPFNFSKSVIFSIDRVCVCMWTVNCVVCQLGGAIASESWTLHSIEQTTKIAFNLCVLFLPRPHWTHSF